MTGELIDLWVLVHLGCCLSIGSSVAAIWFPAWWVHVLYGIIGSYIWEAVEFFLQRTYTETWSGIVEHPANSWIIDPATNILGILFGAWIVSHYRKKRETPKHV